MTACYVAAYAKYVVVEGDDKFQARELGAAALRPLIAELSQRLGRDEPVVVRDVRLVTGDEIQMCGWPHER